MKPTFLFTALFAGLTVTSCTRTHEKTDHSTHASHEKLQEEYACPMHPDVTGKAGDTCNKCGMNLEKVQPAHTVAMTFATQPETIKSGKPATLIFSPRDEAGSVVPLKETHERKLHVITVSHDLAWFDHIHPEPDGGDSYRVTATFPAGGDYLVYADYQAAGQSPQTDKFELHVEGEIAPAPDLHPEKTAVADGYRLTLDVTENLKTGELEIPITIVKDGHALKKQDLENYLGAVAHIILIGMNEKNFLHIHAGSTEQYPIVAHAAVNKPGIYRMWVQFQTKGVVHTAAFTLQFSVR